MEQFYYFLQQDLPSGAFNSWFKFMFWGMFLLFAILICIFFRKCNDKTYRNIILVLWIIILAFEIIKQLYSTFVDNFYMPRGTYEFSEFPYQFCSLALYIYPFIIFYKESKFRDVLMVFASSFLFFAGFLVFFIMPVDKGSAILSTQSMVHHMVQMLIPILTFARYPEKFKFKNFLWSIPVFAVCVLIAVILNEVGYLILPENHRIYLNLFYIAKNNDLFMPGFAIVDVINNIRHQFFIIIPIGYVVLFSIVALVFYALGKYTQKLFTLFTKNKKA